MSIKLPDKLYFKIGEVSQITGLEAYVLRYWETEFADLAPGKSRHNQRLYKKRDVELILKIKALLYDEKFTISGARNYLKKELKEKKTEKNQMNLDLEVSPKLPEIDGFREEVRDTLQKILHEMGQSVTE